MDGPLFARPNKYKRKVELRFIYKSSLKVFLLNT